MLEDGETAVELCDALHPHGVWAQDTAVHSVRVVTHCDVDRAGVERALVVLKEVVAKTQKAGHEENRREGGVDSRMSSGGDGLWRRDSGTGLTSQESSGEEKRSYIC